MKISIKSAPVDGKANAALIGFLAKQCGVTRSRVRLVAGAASRNKTVEIDSPRTLPEPLAHGLDSTLHE